VHSPVCLYSDRNNCSGRRTREAITTKMMIEMGGFGLGVSYDVNVSALKAVTNTRGGIEFSLRYVAPNPFIKTYGANHSRF
jgi:hypothetical protein